MKDKHKRYEPSSRVRKNSRQFSLDHAIELFLQGRSFPEMAHLLKVSKNHLLRNFPRPLLLKTIEKFIMQGLPYEAIAKRWGIDSKTIIFYSKKAGLHDEISKNITHMFNDNIPISEIGEQLRMDPQQVIRWLPAEIKRDRLIELYSEKHLPFKEITRQLGISRSSLKNWLRIYKLKRRHVKAGTETKVYPKSDIILDYLRLNSIQSIATHRRYPRSTITRILEEANVTRTHNLRNVRKHVSRDFYLPLNSYILEVLNGELLGDLSLENKNPKSHNITQLEYNKAINFLEFLKLDHPIEIENTVHRFNQAVSKINSYSMARIRLNISIFAIPWGLHLMKIFETNGIPLVSHFDNANLLASQFHNF